MYDQEHAQHDADASVEGDPTMKPSMGHALGIKLQSLLDG
jgi:hypothetical protein